MFVKMKLKGFCLFIKLFQKVLHYYRISIPFLRHSLAPHKRGQKLVLPSQYVPLYHVERINLNSSDALNILGRKFSLDECVSQ